MAHPTDARLYRKVHQAMLRLARKEGTVLRQSYRKLMDRAYRKRAGHAKANQEPAVPGRGRAGSEPGLPRPSGMSHGKVRNPGRCEDGNMVQPPGGRALPGELLPRHDQAAVRACPVPVTGQEESLGLLAPVGSGPSSKVRNGLVTEEGLGLVHR